MLTITVHNDQGASEVAKRATRAQINGWLAAWAAPEDLTATVRDDNGTEIAIKAIGRKTLEWINHPNRGQAAKSARAYVAARSGVERVHITKDGEVHAYGTMPNTTQTGWYLAGTVKALAIVAAVDGLE